MTLTLTPQIRSLALIFITFTLIMGLFTAAVGLPIAQHFLHIDLGPYGALALLLIAALQSILILLGLMNLHRQNPLVAFFICISILILALFIGFTALDAKEHKNATEEPTSGKMMHL